MNMEKLKERVDAADVVEELLILSNKVFGKNSEEVIKAIDMFITKSYLLGKKNMTKIVDE